MTVAAKTSNYTVAQEALLIAAAAEHGTLNLDLAKALAADPRMNAADGMPRNHRSIVAKASRMNLPYANKVATAKDGSAVAKKASIVAEIAKVVKGNLDGLEVAPKAALLALRDAFVKAA